MKKIFAVLFSLFFVFVLAGCSEKEGGISYDIAAVSDNGVGEITYSVVIKDPATAEQIRKIGQRVIEQAKNSKKYKSLLIDFYDYPEYINYNNTLGRVEYSGGDYKWIIKEKDWSRRLSPQEAKIWAAWQKIDDEENNIPGKRYRTDVTGKAAERLKVSEGKVRDAVDKKLAWQK